MGKLHSQLALFGSIDSEVVERNDPQTTAIVERFLPGTTGYGQRGWFRELRSFLDHLSPAGSVHFPSRDEALRDLVRQPDAGGSPADLPESGRDAEEASPVRPDGCAFVKEMTREAFEQLFDGSDDALPGRETSPTPGSLTWSTLARATYAAAVIAKIEPPPPRRADPFLPRPTFVRWRDGGILHLRDPRGPDDDDPLTTLLEFAAPQPYRRGMNIDVLPSGPTLRESISESHVLDHGRPGWRSFMHQMSRHRAIDPRVADYPAPCVGALRKIDGEFCTVVTTEVVSKQVELHQLEAIVDPRNWHQDLPSFFCAMEPRAKDSAGWNQVLECVSTECDEYRLKTALKYWNATRDRHGLYINYDLAADRHGDSGLVEVDNGYIWITAIPSGGVRIKTSKALRICGLSPTATAALACFSGWAQVGIDMLVNAALQPHQGAVGFDPSTLPDARGARSGNGTAVAQTSAPDWREVRLPDLPPGFRQDLVEDTAEQVNRFIDAASRLATNFARRWQNGLTRTDVQRFGELAGREMTELALGAFDSVIGNFRPNTNRNPSGSQRATPTGRDVIDQLSDTARQMVDDSKSVAAEAADRIDGGAYTAAEMTETAAKLAGIALSGWADFAGFAVDRDGESGPAIAESARHRRSQPATAPPSVAAAEQVRFAGNGVGAALQAMNEMANRAFLANLAVIGELVDQRVPEVASVVTDHMTTVMRRMANQAKMVADDAAKKLDAQGYGPDDWAKTVTKLGDIALVNGIELVGTAVIGPGRYEIGPISSDYFLVQPTHPDQQHTLSIVSPLVLAGGNETIPEDRVTFDPPDGLLPAGINHFRIKVLSRGLRSGIYLGAVWAVPRGAAGSQAASDAVSEELVPVIIGL